MQLIILAAGKSKRIYNKIKKNKCLIEVGGISLIEKIINDSAKYFKKTNIITGFKSILIKNKLENKDNLNFLHNKDYYKTEMLHSLITGLKKINDDVVISYSDILVSKKIWKIFEKPKQNEIFLPIKINWQEIWKARKKNILEDAETLKVNKKKYLIEIGKKIKNLKNIDGQFMGLILIPKKIIPKIIKIYKKYDLKGIQTTQFLNFLLTQNIKIKCKSTKLFWYEIDDFTDLKNLKKIKVKID